MVRYTLAIGDVAIKGERFARFERACARARALAAARKTAVTIRYGDRPATTIDAYGATRGAAYRIKIDARMLGGMFTAANVETEARKLAKCGARVEICDAVGDTLSSVSA